MKGSGEEMNKKIMVVDDNPSHIYTVQEGLHDLEPEYEIIGVNGGKDCIDRLEKGETPDIILLDIMMPEMNGWEVFKKIWQQQAWRKIPIIFLTAKNDNFSRGFGKILAEAYVEKPYDIKDLKQKIDAFLEKPLELSETKQKIVDDMLKYVSDI
jgi:CheY-like chemotaxis protein